MIRNTRLGLLFLLYCMVVLVLPIQADSVDDTNWTVFQAGDPVVAAEINSNLDAIVEAVDDNAIRLAIVEAWGDHSTAGYLTSFTETDPRVGTLASGYIPKWDGSELTDSLIYHTGNNIGVGTSSPQFPLHVIGISVFERSSQWLILNPNHGASDSHALISTASGSEIQLRLGANEGNHVAIDTDGDVGIGTPDPQAKLHVAGASNPVVIKGWANSAEADTLLDTLPVGTMIIGGVDGDRIYFYWKDWDDNEYVYSIQGTALE